MSVPQPCPETAVAAGARVANDDFHLPRLRYADPEPYPADEFQRTHDWMVEWGLLQPESSFDRLVDIRVAT